MEKKREPGIRLKTNPMTHIILLDGKLWAFKPPEKPQYCAGYCEGLRKCSHCQKALEAYNRAYSLALEKKIEVENWEDVGFVNVTGMFYFWNSGNRERLKENEPIKWEGGYSIIEGPKRLIRLIAPVKEEKPCPNCKETVQPCACMRNKCHLCGNPVGNITFTICDDCWDKQYPPQPVPSEQENQEEICRDFVHMLYDIADVTSTSGSSDYVLEEIMKMPFTITRK